MAKEDFCFTYYDGDAARDMSHMNRLERGGYTDLIIAQRKFGWLSIDQIKKILGRDFEEIWPSIELVMKVCDGKYFIDWLETSKQRAQKFSGHQSENGKKGGRPPKNKPNENPTETQIKANQNPSESQKKPLGDGDGSEDKQGLTEGGMGETIPAGIVPEMVQQFKESFPKYFFNQQNDFPAVRQIAENILKWQGLTGDITTQFNSDQIKLRWGEIVIHIGSHQHYREYDLTKINKYFQSIVQSFNNGTSTANRGTYTGSNNKPGTSDARIQAARDW